jgi:hypothetical protein
MSDLVIKDVPDDKVVITEILANAQTTVNNYLAKQHLVVAEAKKVEYETAVSAFKLANKQAIKEEADGLGKDDGGAIKEPSIRPDVVIEPDPAKPANLEPKDS